MWTFFGASLNASQSTEPCISSCEDSDYGVHQVGSTMGLKPSSNTMIFITYWWIPVDGWSWGGRQQAHMAAATQVNTEWSFRSPVGGSECSQVGRAGCAWSYNRGGEWVVERVPLAQALPCCVVWKPDVESGRAVTATKRKNVCEWCARACVCVCERAVTVCVWCASVCVREREWQSCGRAERKKSARGCSSRRLRALPAPDTRVARDWRRAPSPGVPATGDPRIPLEANEQTRAPAVRKGGTKLHSLTCERCTGSMAKWFKEHLGFKTTKAPPPAPPKPDYRHCHTGVPGTPGYQQASSGATFPSPAQPDILAAYKLQKELDFEDPYTPGGNISFAPGLNTVGSPDIKYVSPKHRLIKVETIEKSSPAPGGGVTVTQAVAVGSVKSPTSPPSDHDTKEKVGKVEFTNISLSVVKCKATTTWYLKADFVNYKQPDAAVCRQPH